MNEASKKINLKLDYCYLIIARRLILNEKYENIKETLFSDFRKLK